MRQRSMVGCLSVWLCLTAACDGGRGDGRPALGGGDFSVQVDADTLTVILARGKETLLSLRADGLQLGRVDLVDDAISYDPWPLVAEGLTDYTPPAGLRWLSVASLALREQSEDRLLLALTYTDGHTADLELTRDREGSFRAHLQPTGAAEDIAYFRINAAVDPREGFYGLGGSLDQVEQRGAVRPMQMELDLELESGYTEAHVPVPFLIGTRGWGLFIDSPYPAAFQVASEADDRISATFGTGLASSEGLVFHLFAAGHPLDITRRYYDVTGDPLLPAAWALGPWIWRDENDDQAQVESDVQTIRDLDLATTAIWIDRPYASGVNTFDFLPSQFPDPDAMIARVHDLGFRLGLWHTPYLDEADAATADLLAEARGAGYFPPQTGILFNHWGKPIDLTNPAAYDWWQAHIRLYTDRGIEGFKLDYAEDVVPGLLGVRNPWLFADGSDERTMHSRYQLLYHRVYAETLPATGGFLLCRGGTHGDQVHVSVIWPGDLDANMAHHREVVEDGGGSYVAVGGLPASVIYGLSLGPSGFPFFGADTGGYRHSPPDRETFTRWFEQTALSSVMQVGTSSNNVAWEFDPETGFDEEMLGWYRIYTRLHLRLWPYEWTLAQRIATDGRPIQRPLGLQYPELGQHPDHVYLFGDDLLVAPVVEPGARQKEVIFPPGVWIDWWDGSATTGPQTVTVDAPLDKLPLYQKGGSIVPLLRPTIDTMSPTGQPALVDSFADTPGVLYPRVAPGAASSFLLYDGTAVAQEQTSGGLALSIEPGADFVHGVQFEVVAFGSVAPSAVDGDGAALNAAASLADLEAAGTGWFYDASEVAGTLWIKLGPGAHLIQVSP